MGLFRSFYKMAKSFELTRSFKGGQPMMKNQGLVEMISKVRGVSRKNPAQKDQDQTENRQVLSKRKYESCIAISGAVIIEDNGREGSSTGRNVNGVVILSPEQLP